MPVEFKGDIAAKEWEYLGGALDQGLVFGIWRFPRGFIHRIDFYNTSESLVNFLSDRFGGKVFARHRENKNPPARKTHYQWTIANAEEGLDFLELARGHLHFKANLAEKYALFLQGLLDHTPDIDELLREFNAEKTTSPSTELYLPAPAELAGRLDTNGFIGIQERPNAPLSRAYAEVYLRTEFTGLGLALKEEYGGSLVRDGTSLLWIVHENKAKRVLATVLPDLRNMRERAELVLDFEYINSRLSIKGGKLPPGELLFEELLHGESAPVNRADLLRLGYIARSRELNANPEPLRN